MSGTMPEGLQKGQWTETALRILRERYLAKDGDTQETPDEMCWRVAYAIALAEKKWGATDDDVMSWARQFYDLMVTRQFMPNSPTLMNAGRGSGLQYSACYVLPVEDSMSDIFEAVKRAALIHQSGGGCISEDSMLWTSNRGLEQIKTVCENASIGRVGVRNGNGVAYDVSDLNIETISMNPVTLETGRKRISHVWEYDVDADDQVVVTLISGNKIQTSSWHPFMAIRGTGVTEVAARDLKKGDIVLGSGKIDAFWPNVEYKKVGGITIDEDTAWLIGFTLGDGTFGYVPSLNQYRVRWFSNEREDAEKVQRILTKYNIDVSIQKNNKGLLYVTTMTNWFVCDLLAACELDGFGPKCDKIRIPQNITLSSVSVMRSFLAGLMDSDGYVAKDGSPSYSTVSRLMAYDLSSLMSMFGYSPSIKEKKPHKAGWKTTYDIMLCALPQVNRLFLDIGDYFVSVLRSGRLTSFSRKQTALPLDFWAFRNELFNLGFIGRRKSGTGPIALEMSHWAAHRRINRDSLCKIALLVLDKSPKLSSLLQKVAEDGYEVKSVDRAETAKKYYDLSVDDWNTYAAGQSGLIVIHNTGFSFSRLRPRDSIVRSSGGKASGPVSFMKVFNQATEAVKQGGGRRGANMGVLSVLHPDIMEFVDCKLSGGITNFNISVAATDAFMQAVKDDTEYELIDPHTKTAVKKMKARDVYNHIVKNAWLTGDPGFIFIDRINHSPANPTPELMQIESTNPCVTGDTLVMTDSGEQRIDSLVGKEVNVWNGVEFSPVTPRITGVDASILIVSFSDGSKLTCTPYHRFYVSFNQQIMPIEARGLVKGMTLETFTCPDGTEKSISVKSVESSNKIDTVYCFTEERRHRGMFNGIVTGQCGEQPLFPNESCNLGSLNLSQFVRQQNIDWGELARAVRVAVRFLDDVIDVNPYPLPEIKKAVEGNRRIGLGVMGWADILFMLGIPYDSDKAVTLADEIMGFITNVGHDESERLAIIRGEFANWTYSIYKNGKPLRNATVTTIAPTGTISIIANASSGIEPLFALAFSHNVDDRHMSFVNPIFEQVAKERGLWSDELADEVSKTGMVRGIESLPEDIRKTFVTAHEVAPEWHIKIQAAFQANTDNGVSKTINMTHDATEDDVAKAYMQAYDSGCLGITVYRDGCKQDQVLQIGTKKEEKPKSKKRPVSLKGTTYRKVTPLGTAYVTINEDEKSQPFELFVTVGKAGSDTASVSEAMGRLVSLCLRVPSGLTEKERLAEVVEQLRGIGGARQLGFGKQRVLSLPDGLGQVLEDYLGGTQPVEQKEEKVEVGDLCPECGQATFVYTEGCKKCQSCGYSEC